MALHQNPEEAFAAAFDAFRNSAFRFESLQMYDVEEERKAFQSFLRGDFVAECSPDMREWCSEISAAAKAGKTYQRVRRILFPLSDYTRFEILTGYRFSARAGEQIRLLENDPPGLDLKGVSDFWLFDDSLCFWMTYDPDGKYLGVCQADPSESKRCVQLKNRLIESSVDLHESMAWRRLFPEGVR